MKIVVGLGNFGDAYAYTFHNMGFLAAECLADRLKLKFNKKECDGLIAEGYRNGEKFLIVKPLTYMNLSGSCVKQLVKKYKAELKDVAVVFDDIDLPLGTVRVRAEGSGGTHNGMRNIVDVMASKDVPRIRIGIGRPPEFVSLADYVLSDVPKALRPQIGQAIEKAADEAEKFLFQV